MAYFNTSPSTSRAVLQVATATILSTTTGFVVPALQDITVNNGTAVFNWTQLDSFGQQSLPTPATNSVSGNLVVDPTTYFGADAGGSVPGLHTLSNNATKVFWRVYFDGQKAGSRFISGSGYVTGLAPSTNPTAPVFVTPFTIAADGEISTGTV
jgi:hypothetical protein